MQIITSPKEFQSECWSWRSQGLTSALVPTMGYLHQGHLSLITWARENAQKVAVSVFVNPSQFGAGEDLSGYPRDPEGDAAKAAKAGADVVFMPEPGDMYPSGFATTVSVSGLTEGLCGRTRPTHFAGVTTVVSKLFLMAMPTVAVFGQKDWQQVAVIRRMVQDLGFPVDIEARPIFRESDGLAMSSRNVNLSPDEHAQAVEISRGLAMAKDLVAAGERSPRKVIAAVEDHYRKHMPSAETDYVECIHPDTLNPVGDAAGPCLMAVAVRFPKARLIDNMLMH